MKHLLIFFTWWNCEIFDSSFKIKKNWNKEWEKCIFIWKNKVLLKKGSRVWIELIAITTVLNTFYSQGVINLFPRSTLKLDQRIYSSIQRREHQRKDEEEDANVFIHIFSINNTGSHLHNGVSCFMTSTAEFQSVVCMICMYSFAGMPPKTLVRWNGLS